jgi:hypothetical protein
MREIKFKVWDTKRNQFVSEFDIVFRQYGGVEIDIYPNTIDYIGDECHNGEPQRGRFEVMQYTGLVDKNGVEIYEADFIGKKGAYVVWSERLSCWCFKFHNDEIETPLYHDDISKHEVIGNIYENPELLNK